LYLLAPDNHLVQYVALPCHMDGLALGGLLAIVYRTGNWRISRVTLSWLAVAMIGVTVGVAWLGGWFYHKPLVRTVGFLVASLASVVVVMWLIEFRGSRLTAPLRYGFVQYIGKISYGLYMLHWLVLAVVSWYYPGYHARTDLWGCAIVLGITLALAALSWRFLESPLLTLKDRFTRAAAPDASRQTGGASSQV
jgi:peptidoglycan/LPS O-acetylase OafA/YrhL